MLATLGDASDIHDEAGWAFEMKWDGIRALAIVHDGSMRLMTRNGNDVTGSYPDLDELVELVGGNAAVLDGEIVALNKAGRPDFGVLQTRMKLTKQADVSRAVARTPVHYMLFDLLELNGTDLTSLDYDSRRHELEALIAPTRASAVQVPPAFTGRLSEAFESSRELGLEGVVAKERDGRYWIGKRSRGWIKIKHHRTQEVVVGGWRPGRGRRADSIGSLLVGLPEGKGFRYIGRVGTGFNDRQLEDLRETLAKRRRTTAPLSGVPASDARDAHWVRPDLVGEVEFAEWTSSGRLRQPSWRGWRPDKAPADVQREI
jgi:bifunctional non-homologous end joining protein LigD